MTPRVLQHPRDRIYQALRRLKRHFDENEASRVQVALLALFFALLGWIAGVMAGSALALLIVLMTASGLFAVYAFVGTALLIGIAGSVRAFRLYQQKISEQQ